MTAFQLQPASGSTRRACAALTLAVAGSVGACRDAELNTAPSVPVADLALSTDGPGRPSLCVNCVPQDRILYVREWPQGVGVIHRMKPDGTDDVTLGQGTNPAWSPMKTKIAFVYMEDIWVMNYDGTGRAQITHTPQWAERDPSWSPDGQYIAYSRNQTPNIPHSARDVWTMKADGSHHVKLTWASNLDERRPSWSPDGTKIALMSRVDNTVDEYAIWIMTIDPVTRDGLLLSSFTTKATGWAVSPVWSPDGTKIAFTSSTLGCGIAIQSVGSQTPQPFAPAGVAKCLDPAWSPNGLKLAFVVRNMSGGPSSIATSSLNGTGLTYLTPGNTIDFTPAWHRK